MPAISPTSGPKLYAVLPRARRAAAPARQHDLRHAALLHRRRLSSTSIYDAIARGGRRAGSGAVNSAMTARRSSASATTPRERRVANAEIEQRLGLEPRLDRAPHRHPRAPLRRRRRSADRHGAVHAGEMALDAVRRSTARDIALTLLATSTPDHLLPPSAPLLAHRLGLAQFRRHRPGGRLRRLPLCADAGRRLRAHARRAGAGRRGQHPVAAHQSGTSAAAASCSPTPPARWSLAPSAAAGQRACSAPSSRPTAAATTSSRSPPAAAAARSRPTRPSRRP